MGNELGTGDRHHASCPVRVVEQVTRQLADLNTEERRVRQEEITAEVIELAAGASANSDKARY